MAITRSYNKHTGIYYAYETTYTWDEIKQKKVQKKICIGQFDPETDEIIPNAKRGRPRKSLAKVSSDNSDTLSNVNDTYTEKIEFLETRIREIENIVEQTLSQLQSFKNELTKLKTKK